MSLPFVIHEDDEVMHMESEDSRNYEIRANQRMRDLEALMETMQANEDLLKLRQFYTGLRATLARIFDQRGVWKNIQGRPLVDSYNFGKKRDEARANRIILNWFGFTPGPSFRNDILAMSDFMTLVINEGNLIAHPKALQNLGEVSRAITLGELLALEETHIQGPMTHIAVRRSTRTRLERFETVRRDFLVGTNDDHI